MNLAVPSCARGHGLLHRVGNADGSIDHASGKAEGRGDQDADGHRRGDLHALELAVGAVGPSAAAGQTVLAPARPACRSAYVLVRRQRCHCASTAPAKTAASAFGPSWPWLQGPGPCARAMPRTPRRSAGRRCHRRRWHHRLDRYPSGPDRAPDAHEQLIGQGIHTRLPATSLRARGWRQPACRPWYDSWPGQAPPGQLEPVRNCSSCRRSTGFFVGLFCIAGLTGLQVIRPLR